jgi:hypothetical protein
MVPVCQLFDPSATRMALEWMTARVLELSTKANSNKQSRIHTGASMPVRKIPGMSKRDHVIAISCKRAKRGDVMNKSGQWRSSSNSTGIYKGSASNYYLDFSISLAISNRFGKARSRSSLGACS